MSMSPFAFLAAARARVAKEKAEREKHNLANQASLDAARMIQKPQKGCQYKVDTPYGVTITCKLLEGHEGGHDLNLPSGTVSFSFSYSPS